MIKYVLYFLLIVTLPYNLFAFKANPLSTFDESQNKYTSNILHSKLNIYPKHENFTLAALNHAKNFSPSIDFLLEDLVFGVRWNDDPLQYAKSHKKDFYVYYKDSCEEGKEIGPKWDLLYRTHCGDMQFLHAMASSKKETAIETKNKIMMWLEFTYKVSTGAIPKNRYFRELDVLLDDNESKTLFTYLLTNNGERRMKWQPEDLFTLKCDRDFSLWKWIKNVFVDNETTKLTCEDFHNQHNEIKIQSRALGSFIHVIQDSFSDSHVSRFPNKARGVSYLNNRGKVKNFLVYNLQDETKHESADICIDTDEELDSSYTLNLLSITSQIITLAYEDKESNIDNWKKVKLILDKVFELDNNLAIPNGGNYKK